MLQPNLEAALKTIFPAYSKKIHVLIEQNQNFREIAKDYLFYRKELNLLLRSNQKNLFNQYHDTIADLEKELKLYFTSTANFSNSEYEVH